MNKIFRIIYKREGGFADGKGTNTANWHVSGDSPEQCIQKYNDRGPVKNAELNDFSKCEIVRIEETPKEELEELMKHKYFLSDFVY